MANGSKWGCRSLYSPSEAAFEGEMGTKSPFGVLQPRLPGAPLSERRDCSVLRRETPARTSVLSGEELARARTKERLESWATAGLKDEMEWILSVVRSMVYMKEGCIVGGERCAEKSAFVVVAHNE